MTQHQALIALQKMEKNALVERMVRAVKLSGRVPTWVKNEIEFSAIPDKEISIGSTSGNEAIMEDRNYHGGYVE